MRTRCGKPRPRIPRALSDWRPRAVEPVMHGDVRSMRDGEPNVQRLVRYDVRDKAVSCESVIACCDCGLNHHFTFEVFRDPDGEFFLRRRATRVPKNPKR